MKHIICPTHLPSSPQPHTPVLLEKKCDKVPLTPHYTQRFSIHDIPHLPFSSRMALHRGYLYLEIIFQKIFNKVCMPTFLGFTPFFKSCMYVVYVQVLYKYTQERDPWEGRRRRRRRCYKLIYCQYFGQRVEPSRYFIFFCDLISFVFFFLFSFSVPLRPL